MFFYWQVKNYVKKEGYRKSQNITVDEYLVEITIPRNSPKSTAQYQFVEDHEIRYEGKMYDIVSRKVFNDKLILTCISDEDEDKLEKAFADQVENDNTSNIPIKSIIKRLIQDGVNIPNHRTFLYERIVGYNSFLAVFYLSPQSDVLTPPPNTFC